MIKGYVSVFVRFSTKAIHFVQTYPRQRFKLHLLASLGGEVVTDNGRNFLGESRILELEFTIFVNTIANDIAQKYITR